MANLKEMTKEELKKYLSEYRDDDSKFSEALSELLTRDPNPIIYSADLPLEEIEKVFKDKIEQVKSSNY